MFSNRQLLAEIVITGATLAAVAVEIGRMVERWKAWLPELTPMRCVLSLFHKTVEVMRSAVVARVLV
jgi:hypothetical protein